MEENVMNEVQLQIFKSEYLESLNQFHLPHEQ